MVIVKLNNSGHDKSFQKSENMREMQRNLPSEITSKHIPYYT